MSEELRPCPFCGKEPAIDNNFAICVNDDCELSDYWSGLEVGSWNTRPIEDALNARIAELEAEICKWLTKIHKEFCPNCEAETPCTHEAELFVCDICGEDFAKYIVSRNCTLPDVSMTQDVLTPIKTSQSNENTNPNYYKEAQE